MDVAAWIVESVREGPRQGSQLAHSVRTQYPEWSPEQAGARNLRDFVERFVDGVTVVGRSGMDVIYGQSDAADGEPGRPTSRGSEQNVNYWRIWVSPNSPYALAVDTLTGDVDYVPRAAASEKDGAKLEPAPRERHEELAREFAERVRSERGVALPPVGGDDGWWYDWQRSLKSLGLEAAWHVHRSSALESTLRESLDEAGLSEGVKERALGLIVSDRSARRPTRSIAERVTESTRAQLEATLVAAIPMMDTSDLRALKIPIGVLLDAVAQRAER